MANFFFVAVALLAVLHSSSSMSDEIPGTKIQQEDYVPHGTLEYYASWVVSKVSKIWIECLAALAAILVLHLMISLVFIIVNSREDTQVQLEEMLLKCRIGEGATPIGMLIPIDDTDESSPHLRALL